MCAKINLADVVVLQDGGVSGVGSVMGSTMVQGTAGREGEPSVEPVFLNQLPGTIFQTLAGQRRGNKVRQQTRNQTVPNKRGSYARKLHGVSSSFWILTSKRL